MEECDTLLIVGSSFPYLDFYPKPGKAKCVQIDLDSTRIGLRYPVDVGLVGNSREVLQALIPLLQRKKERGFLETAQKRMQKWRELMEERGTQMDLPMKPQVVTYHLNRLLNNDAIIASDSGTIATWAARYIDIPGDMKFSLSGRLASMANGLPYSIGAAVAYPGRQVVCIVGDGGFTMLMGEMATLVKYKLPVKIIIIKNNSLARSSGSRLCWTRILNSALTCSPSTSHSMRKQRAQRASAFAIPRKPRARCAARSNTTGRRWWKLWSTRTSLRCRVISS